MNAIKVFFGLIGVAYRQNPKFRAIVQTIEGGAVVGFVTASASGFDLSKHGLHVLAGAIASAALVALRNYFLNPANYAAPEPPAPKENK